MNLEYDTLARYIGSLELQVMQLQQENQDLSRYNDTLRAKLDIAEGLDIIEGLKEGDAQRPMTDTSTASSATSESLST